MSLITTPTVGNCNSLVYNDNVAFCAFEHLVRDIWLRNCWATWTGNVDFHRRWTEWNDELTQMYTFISKPHTATKEKVRCEYRYDSFRHKYFGRNPWWRRNNGNDINLPYDDYREPRCSCIPIVNGEDTYTVDPINPPAYLPREEIVFYEDVYGTWPIWRAEILLQPAVWKDPVTLIDDADYGTIGCTFTIRSYADADYGTFGYFAQRGKYLASTSWQNNIPEDCDYIIGDYTYLSSSYSSTNTGYWYTSYGVINTPGTLTVHSTDQI